MEFDNCIYLILTEPLVFLATTSELVPTHTMWFDKIRCFPVPEQIVCLPEWEVHTASPWRWLPVSPLDRSLSPSVPRYLLIFPCLLRIHSNSLSSITTFMPQCIIKPFTISRITTPHTWLKLFAVPSLNSLEGKRSCDPTSGASPSLTVKITCEAARMAGSRQKATLSSTFQSTGALLRRTRWHTSLSANRWSLEWNTMTCCWWC